MVIRSNHLLNWKCKGKQIIGASDLSQIMDSKLDIVAHACNLSTQKAEVGGAPWVWGQSCLQRKGGNLNYNNMTLKLQDQAIKEARVWFHLPFLDRRSSVSSCVFLEILKSSKTTHFSCWGHKIMAYLLWKLRLEETWSVGCSMFCFTCSPPIDLHLFPWGQSQIPWICLWLAAPRIEPNGKQYWNLESGHGDGLRILRETGLHCRWH